MSSGVALLPGSNKAGPNKSPTCPFGWCAWVPTVKRLHELLFEGDSIQRMMQVTGEEGISIEDFIVFQKALLLDMVFLQQDAFDDVDAAVPRERQVESFELVTALIDADLDFVERDAAREFFTRVTGLYKNWNYAAPQSPEYGRYKGEIEALVDQHRADESNRSEPSSP